MSNREEVRRSLMRELQRRFLESSNVLSSDVFWSLIEPSSLMDEIDSSLVEREKNSSVSLNNLKTRVKSLEGNFTQVLSDLNEIKGLLWKRESKKDESILEFKKNASKIDTVDSIFCKTTEEGVDFLILIDSENFSNTLKEIIAFQIDLEKRYNSILFDFIIEPISELTPNTSGWSPLYIKV